MPLHGRDNVNKAIDVLVANKNKKVKGIFITGLSRIAMGTPVMHGAARNNWFLGVGKMPSNGVIAKVKRKMSRRSSGAGNSLSSINKIPAYVLDKKLFYVNRMPYINKLEYGGYPNPAKDGTYDKKSKEFKKRTEGGFSDQAVGGWVRKEMDVMRLALRRIK